MAREGICGVAELMPFESVLPTLSNPVAFGAQPVYQEQLEGGGRIPVLGLKPIVARAVMPLAVAVGR